MWQQFSNGHTLYYCDNCYQAILRGLEDSVELPTHIIDGCVTSRSSHHVKKKKGYTCLDLAKLKTSGSQVRWKFSNSTRKNIIRILSAYVPN
jgi:hypothetical protein